MKNYQIKCYDLKIPYQEKDEAYPANSPEKAIMKFCRYYQITEGEVTVKGYGKYTVTSKLNEYSRSQLVITSEKDDLNV